MGEHAKEDINLNSTILDRWNITAKELTDIIDQNPSLRGFMMGYVSESVLKKTHFTDERLKNVRKDDDHDRSKKGDLTFEYRGHEFKVEAKSLQTNSVKNENGLLFGKFQCDASDCRDILLPNNNTVNTTCLLVGEFDIVAVNLFAFNNEWKFAFAKNEDLPTVSRRSKKIGEDDKQYLLSTLIPITYPLQAPFVEDPFILLDELVEEKNAHKDIEMQGAILD